MEHNQPFLHPLCVFPYGYTIDLGPFAGLWLFLGVSQLIWGGRQISRLLNFRIAPKETTEQERQQTRKSLENFVKKPVSPADGQLELSMMDACEYAVQLFADIAVCVEKSLRDFFVIEKRTASQWNWRVDKTIVVLDYYGIEKIISVREPSLRAFKDWSTVSSDTQ